MGMAYKSVRGGPLMGSVSITLAGTPPSGASVTLTGCGAIIGAQFTDGTAKLLFKEEGTYAIAVTEGIYGAPESITVASGGRYELTLYAGIDNYEAWSVIGGLDPSDYASLAVLCADADAMETLMNTAAAVDYMIDSTAVIMPAVVGSQTAMTQLGLSSYAADAMVASAAWTTAVLGSANAIAGLDASVPISIPVMTGNTTPSGVCTSSSDYVNGSDVRAAYMAFNNRANSWIAGSAGAHWVTYEFPEPLWVYKIRFMAGTGGNLAHEISYYVRVSADGNTWTTISNTLYQSYNDGSVSTVMLPHTGKCKYVRIETDSLHVFNHTALYGAAGNQIYGK